MGLNDYPDRREINPSGKHVRILSFYILGNSFAKGMYFIHVVQGQNSKTLKIIKE